MKVSVSFSTTSFQLSQPSPSIQYGFPPVRSAGLPSALTKMKSGSQIIFIFFASRFIPRIFSMEERRSKKNKGNKRETSEIFMFFHSFSPLEIHLPSYRVLYVKFTPRAFSLIVRSSSQLPPQIFSSLMVWLREAFIEFTFILWD